MTELLLIIRLIQFQSFIFEIPALHSLKIDNFHLNWTLISIYRNVFVLHSVCSSRVTKIATFPVVLCRIISFIDLALYIIEPFRKEISPVVAIHQLCSGTKYRRDQNRPRNSSRNYSFVNKS